MNMSISIDFYVCTSEMNENIWAYFFLQFTSEVLIVEKTYCWTIHNSLLAAIHLCNYN